MGIIVIVTLEPYLDEFENYQKVIISIFFLY